MNRFSNSEIADMHMMYNLVNGNARLAARLHAERFLNRHLPLIVFPQGCINGCETLTVLR